MQKTCCQATVKSDIIVAVVKVLLSKFLIIDKYANMISLKICLPWVPDQEGFFLPFRD